MNFPPRLYTAGFVFDPTGESVLLIEKKTPEWQAGKLNAGGGKWETGDISFAHTQSRETMEEFGLTVPPQDWTQFDCEVFPFAHVHWFYTIHSDIWSARKMENEEPKIVKVKDIIEEVTKSEKTALYNLPYLLAKAYTFAFAPANENYQIPNSDRFQ